MRTFDQAAAAWREVKAVFRKHQSLDELRDSIRNNHDASAIVQPGVRSTFWKVFLLFETTNTNEWSKILASSRSAYNAVREHYQNVADDLSPSISGDNNGNDVELQTEIRQDVERCMPDNLYFRQPATQTMLSDILFVFCKLNPDTGYRQGMHELLAPILFVVERDAIDLGPTSKAFGEDAVIRNVFDADHIEHDSFTLFCQVMQNAKAFYEQTTHSGKENPIVGRSRRIFDELLPKIDPELATHLQSIEILPQIFLMRWIRLLFGREFSFDQTLSLWDVIFAVDTSLGIVDYISILMLLKVRWKLLDSGYHDALTMLLQNPLPKSSFNTANFALDALYLQLHPDFEGSSYVVLKYTDRALQPTERPNTPPALQRNITTFSGAFQAIRSTPSPSRNSRQSRNIENMLQSTARNLYARSEKLGINKAMRNAMDEVHRKALEIREAQDAATPRSEVRSLQRRLEVLEARQTQLAVLLSEAIDAIRSHQEGTNTRVVGPTETLDAAIAKAHYVQVHLQHPELALDTTDVEVKRIETQPTTSESDPSLEDGRKGLQDAREPSVMQMKMLDTSDFPDRKESPSGLQTSIPDQQAMPTVTSSIPLASQRPALDDDQFSWMLGHEGRAEEDPPRLLQRELTPRSNLFGADDASQYTGTAEEPSPSERPVRSKQKRQDVKRSVTIAAEDPFSSS